MQITSGDVAVVTGAGSGIGRSLALAFAGRGCALALADVQSDALDATIAELAAAAPDVQVVGVVTDVADPLSVDAFAEATMSRFGRVDIVCNNAGVGGGGNTWQLSVDDWTWLIGVNLWGVINGIRAFVPHLIEQRRGHVVNTASVAGLVAAPGMAHYNATKHAVVGLSETLFRELGALGADLGVSVVCPSWVNTRIYAAERNRPPSLNGGAAPDAGALAEIEDLASGFFASAMSPDEVAAQVVSAVDEGRFWVLTHPEMNAHIVDRFVGATEGRNPSFDNPFA